MDQITLQWIVITAERIVRDFCNKSTLDLWVDRICIGIWYGSNWASSCCQGRQRKWVSLRKREERVFCWRFMQTGYLSLSASCHSESSMWSTFTDLCFVLLSFPIPSPAFLWCHTHFLMHISSMCLPLQMSRIMMSCSIHTSSCTGQHFITSLPRTGWMVSQHALWPWGMMWTMHPWSSICWQISLLVRNCWK